MVQIYDQFIRMMQDRGFAKLLKVLMLFLENPEKKYYKEQLRKALGISKVTISKNIDSLAKMKIIIPEPVGRSTPYSLNRTHPIVRQFKIFLAIGKVVSAMPNIKDTEVYLYGSAARGEDSKESDIDLLFIGRIEKKEAIRISEGIAQKMGKKTTPLIFSEPDFAALGKKDHAFYDKISREKIRVYPWT